MLRKVLILCFAGFATVALAHHILAIGSNGSGTATTHDGRVGTFHHSVVKRTAPKHHPTFDGSLAFEQHANHFGPWVSIQMGRPTAVAVAGTVCEFSGAGSLSRLVNGHKVTEHGHVSVPVNDRRNPHHTPHNDPDTFSIQFVNKGTTFSFDGTLHNGDLVVFSRQEH
jgi:hypothetical protein